MTSKHPWTLILASRSPRRRQLLAEAGYRFEVIPPDDAAEGPPEPGESPERHVARLAEAKAGDVVRRIAPERPELFDSCDRPPPLVLGCDTVAECDGAILGKPRDRDHAREILLRLSGREHRVLSGVCLWPIGRAQSQPEPAVRVAETRLRMDRLSAEQLDTYLAGGQWQGKAGAFGYQDRIGWVHVIEGSESNVVGLPMELLAEMLSSHR